MVRPVEIGGKAVALLRTDPASFEGPGFVDAMVLPGRGMMLLQARLRLPDGRLVDALAAPDLPQAATELAGGPDDFAGNASFRFGGAILAPFANRIRGAPLLHAREVETDIGGLPTRLPRNWGGQAPGAEQYAMHGLILAAPFEARADGPSAMSGRLDADDFAGHWPGKTRIDVAWRLEAGALVLKVRATNVGDLAVPMGLGWHPYFALPSADRAQARLSIPASSRVIVNNYDEVLPTGELRAVAGTGHDLSEAGGRALGDLYLDDCYTRFDKSTNATMAELRDPAAGLGLRIASPSPAARALQVYAPPSHDYVVLEPQFNLPNPFGPEWEGEDTGMVTLQPGQSTDYDVSVTAFALPTAA